MIKVSVKKQSSYPVSAKKIKDTLRAYFKKEGIVSDAQVSIALLGEAKMLDISKKFLKDKSLHNVLSFTQEELRNEPNFVYGKAANFVYPPDGVIYLGEIIICFPKAFQEAKEENKLIEEKILELVAHGADHLLGKHHT